MTQPQVISVPGRVNLIGEHIDYHDLPVLPMAIQRKVTITFRDRRDRLIRATSPSYPDREFSLADLSAFAPGDWGNYLKAAVRMIARRWTVAQGIDAAITSDLPSAAGLSSSSALLTGFALALLRVNGIRPTVYELMELLPEGEQFVGTRGGGMDHAAVLASRAGCGLLVQFAPFQYEPIPIPPGWGFVVAHSLTVAEKSGGVKAEYNARRTAGLNALRALGFATFRAALEAGYPEQLAVALPHREREAFLHVTSEAERVEGAVEALREDDIARFGKVLLASHASLRDHLRVSNAALDELVECALQAGALGGRLTGAGFGGCAIILCKLPELDSVRDRLTNAFYRRRLGFDPAQHLITAEPSAGALCG
ncbi:MAG: hypothetical protein JO210_08900 [Acidobacteriaceae bacterium]|nr:hypothetical protein [Acidobacteriaceae bacterium]